MYFSRNFQAQKMKKKALLKCFLYFGEKWNFLAPGLKNLYFRRELPKAENQIRSYSLELLTYYCIHYSLAILFSDIGLLIMHPTIDISQNFRYFLRVKRKKNICASGNEITLQIIIRTFEGLHLY